MNGIPISRNPGKGESEPATWEVGSAWEPPAGWAILRSNLNSVFICSRLFVAWGFYGFPGIRRGLENPSPSEHNGKGPACCRAALSELHCSKQQSWSSLGSWEKQTTLWSLKVTAQERVLDCFVPNSRKECQQSVRHLQQDTGRGFKVCGGIKK